MAITHYTNTGEAPTPFSSSNLEQTEVAVEAEGALSGEPNETSALLTKRGPSAISSFLDQNAGLLLVASSQFFFSASNLCVKWLNSLDESERVPILEVRDILGHLIL